MLRLITLEQACNLVRFEYDEKKGWQVRNVDGDVSRNVSGAVGGHVCGDIKGSVRGNVVGIVCGTISGRQWTFVETLEEKLQRLIEESGNQELIDTFNQMEGN